MNVNVSDIKIVKDRVIETLSVKCKFTAKTTQLIPFFLLNYTIIQPIIKKKIVFKLFLISPFVSFGREGLNHFNN